MMISKLPASARTGVNWAGLRPRPSGYCYLELFAAEFQAAAVQLGVEPTVSQVARLARSMPGSIVDALVSLTLRMSGQEVIAHVQYNDGTQGIQASEVLKCLPGGMKIGSMSNACWPDGQFGLTTAYGNGGGAATGPRFEGSWQFGPQVPRRFTPHPGHADSDVLDESDVEVEAEPQLADRNGFCYLRLLRPELWERAAKKLGIMPAVADIVKFLQPYVHPFVTCGVVVTYHNIDGLIVVHVARGVSNLCIPADRALGVILPELRMGAAAVQAASAAIPQVVSLDDVPDGYCYLRLFRQALWVSAAKMGANPTVADLRRFANAHADPFSGQGCVVQVTGKSNGAALAHVVSGEGAGVLSASQALASLDKKTLVGSAGTVSVVRDSTANEAAAGTPVSMEVHQTRPVHYIQLPVGGYLNHQENYMVLNPRTIRGLRRTFGLFESVRLEEFSITVTVQGDVSTVARLAANISNAPPPDNGAWATAEASMTITGNAQGATISAFTLPPNHQFGRELKGLSISNEPPIFHFYVTSAVPCHVWFRGHFKLAMSGQGNPPGVDLSATAGKMSAMHPACVIAAGAGMGIVAEDSDDDEEPPKPRSPPQTRSGVPGSGSGAAANAAARRQ